MGRLLHSLVVLVSLGVGWTATASDRVDLEIEVVDAEGLPLPGTTIETREHDEPISRAVTDPEGRARVSLPCHAAMNFSFPGATGLVHEIESCRVPTSRLRVCLDGMHMERIHLDCRGPVVDPNPTEVSTRFRSGFLSGLPGAPSSGRLPRYRPPKRDRPPPAPRCERSLTWLPDPDPGQ